MPALVRQRVTATVKRQALQLVRLETEREAFLTTPEHPFATPRSGWVSAGRLVPGDWVVSERFGAVRLLSMRSEPAARPVPVFNLSVASSHAYFVGTSRVLVHNTNCQPSTSESHDAAFQELIRKREELNAEIKDLTNTEPGSPRIAELRAERDGVQRQIDALRDAQRKRAAPEAQAKKKAKQDAPTARLLQAPGHPTDTTPPDLPEAEPAGLHQTEAEPAGPHQTYESHTEAIERKLLDRDKLNGEIKALAKTAPESPRIAELRARRHALQTEIDNARRAQRSGDGAVPAIKVDRTLQKYETQSETERKALEDLKNQLAELESRPPKSEAEQAAFLARQAELVGQIQKLEFSHGRTQRILNWLRELAEAEKATPATDAAHRALDERKKELLANIKRERVAERSLRSRRRILAAPGALEKKRAYDKALRGRLFQTAAHRADTTRARDPLELLQAELADLLDAPPSESRDLRILHLTEQIDTMKQLIELRRERRRIQPKLKRARSEREKLSALGSDTRELDGRIEQLGLRMRAVRIEIARLRVREHLLARLDETAWGLGPGSVDEAQLREFERQLAEGILNEEQLAGIEQALDAMDPTPADLQQAVLDEAEDVDEVLSDREDLRQQPPSPERAAGLQSSFERLQQELREHRRALDAAVARLANEYAFVEGTRASSSSGPSWQERLRAIHQEQLDLQATWRAGLRTRLESARQQLFLVQSIDVLNDEAIEADLAREIALLERELQNAGG